MSVADVLQRDLRSVYRSRTGTAVGAITALCTVVAVGLVGLTPDPVVGLVGGLLTVGVLLALVFLGNPKQIAITACLFTVVAVGLALGLSDPTTFRPPMRSAIVGVGSLLSIMIPIVALLSSYATIVGERNSGSVRFLVGLPNSRSDAFLGKFVSRSLVVVVPLVLGLVLTGIVVELTFDGGSLLGVLGLAAVSIPYALIFIGLGLSASTYAKTVYQAVALVVVAFITLRIGWTVLRYLSVWEVQHPPYPEYFYWIAALNPFNAYVTLTSLLTTVEPHHPLLFYPINTVVRDGTYITIQGTETIARSPTVAAVVLFGWMVLTPLAGYYKFKRTDLL